jgi:hypothetical protein
MMGAEEVPATRADIAELKDMIGDLRRDMDQRFDQVDQRSDQVDQRFDQVDQRSTKWTSGSTKWTGSSATCAKDRRASERNSEP